MANVKTASTGFRRVRFRSKTGKYMIAAWILLLFVAVGVGFVLYSVAGLVDKMFRPVAADPKDVVQFRLDEAKTIERLGGASTGR